MLVTTTHSLTSTDLEGRIAAAQGTGIDPGATGEIHLNLAE